MSDTVPVPEKPQRGLTSKIVEVFLTSKLSILFLIASMLAGAAALLVTPREEEPQIVVPVADLFVAVPGASAEEVEKLAATPLESRLWEVDGVENVYSMSQPGQALLTVRFHVGQDRERSLVKVWNKVMSSQDAMPPGVAGWSLKPVEIDDVPIVTLALHSASPAYGGPESSPSGLAKPSDPLMQGHELRRIADEVLDELQRVPDTGRAWVVGGERRRVSVDLDPARLAARGLAPLDVVRALRGANVEAAAGEIASDGRAIRVQAGPFLASAGEVGTVVVAAQRGRPVYLRDVADVVDGPEEPSSYTRIGFGPAAGAGAGGGPERPAVTIAVAKRKGTNAVRVSHRVIAAVDGLRGRTIPPDVAVTVTRDNGETANHKVNELVKHLLVAVATIVVLLAIALGPKEALIVALAVPMTLAITLLLDLLFGYSINRVTLFALILSLGLLVDDPIVDVENIFRHFKLRREPPLEATLTAVDEVRPPTILATFTVIVSFLPMFFITGMMGPYMAPMAFNVPVAMLVSLAVAFTVTPWATYHLLKGEYGHEEAPFDLRKSAAWRLTDGVLGGLLRSRRRAVAFLLAVALAFLGSVALAATRAVPLKMLPFDDKNELLLVIDTPEGTTLEATDALAREVGGYLGRVAEVTDYETFAGTPSPIDFNGLVRHYYLRSGGNVAEIRVNLLAKERRGMQSHAIALRIRPDLERIARRFPGASVKVVESPPGPPVLATLVAEVRGPREAPHAALLAAAARVRADLERTAGVVDLDDYAEAPRPEVRFRIDREKAMLHGIAAADVVETLRTAVGGTTAGAVHAAGERLPLGIDVRLPRAARSSVRDLLALRVRGASGDLVPLGEIGRVEEGTTEPTIHHKDLRRVAYVVAEVAGRSPVEAVLDLKRALRERPLPAGFEVDLAGEGEWKITVEAFRDLGLAFAAALAMIYVLLVAQTGSLGIPLVIMVAIPLTLIGIMPGFWLLDKLFGTTVAGFANPTFFTATGMIGMIALAGIVVRNSIILIDFMEHLRARGDVGLEEAVIEAVATRLRPIFLTAGAAMFGSFVITLDPIFAGLAWSFIFGIFASTLFTLVVVPVIYYGIRARGGEAAKTVGSTPVG